MSFAHMKWGVHEKAVLAPRAALHELTVLILVVIARYSARRATVHKLVRRAHDFRSLRKFEIPQ
jgi:hypothetical protein